MTDLPAETCADIDDAVTLDDLAECLTHLACFARRQPCVIGTELLPSAWDKAHRAMDGPLDDYLAKAHA